jgi:hypothetical protein
MGEFINFQDNTITYKIVNGDIEIRGKWLFNKMLQFEWDIISYFIKNNELHLYGMYSDDKIVEIKKFFYDSYPYVLSVYPQNSELCIYFSTNINFTMN